MGWGVKGGTTDSQGVEEFLEGQMSKPITDTVNVRQIFAVRAGLPQQLLNILKLQTLKQVKGGWVGGPRAYVLGLHLTPTAV